MIYFIRAVGTDLVKIGYTAGNPAERMRALQVGCPHDLVVEHTMPGDVGDEGALHNIFQGRHARGEWHRLTTAHVRDIRGWYPLVKRGEADPSSFDYDYGGWEVLALAKVASGLPEGAHHDEMVAALVRQCAKHVSAIAFHSGGNGYSNVCLCCGFGIGHDEDSDDDGHPPTCPVGLVCRAARRAVA